jgi:hypothetical protein
MCTVDVTPIPYHWYSKYAAYMPATGIVHTCRNFEAVQDWAQERQISGWDVEKKLTDPLGDVLHEYTEEWCKENGCEHTEESDHHNQHLHDHDMHHG